MKTLYIDGTEDTPTIDFNPGKKQYKITGRSLPEDVITFYNPVQVWLDSFLQNLTDEATFVFKLVYFNTASSKIIQEIIIKLDKAHEQGKNIKILWYFDNDDEDIADMGREYKDLVTIPFDLLPF